MKIKGFILIIAVVLFLIHNGIAYCDSELSYNDTVNLLKETMLNSTSDVRKESYEYIKFNKCDLDYNVLGTYPAGGIYNIKYSNIDFASLNYKVSKVGHDYTAFIILNFDNYIKSEDTLNDIAIHTIVINVYDDAKAQILFKAFLHLGELCGARNKQL